MKTRLNIYEVGPGAYAAVTALDRYVVQESGISPSMLVLIKLRASQINGCAYCVDMHSKEAQALGLGAQWVNLISAWQESPVYSDAERAILGWTEALTLLSETRAPDADFEALKAHFSDAEIANITVAIGAINIWNRIAVGFRIQHKVDKQFDLTGVESGSSATAPLEPSGDAR